jgi:molybdate transport system substrate-binding protein
MKISRILIFLTALLATIVVACGQSNQTTPTAQVKGPQIENLTVSAAISLREALTKIQSLYQQTKETAKLTYNFGSSGALQQQIEQGAPVDVFVSAAAKQMDRLQEKGLLLANTRKNLLTNQMVLIAPKDRQTIQRFEDLGSERVKRVAVGEPKSVPAGQYAQEILEFYRLSDRVKPKLIYAKDVRQVLTYVETGNVDAGLVYVTDIRNSQKVAMIATAPQNSHKPIVYPVAVLSKSKNQQAAQDFVQFLFTKPAVSVFESYGFKLP